MSKKTQRPSLKLRSSSVAQSDGYLEPVTLPGETSKRDAALAEAKRRGMKVGK